MISMEIPYPSAETIKLFLHKIEKRGDCWIWTASTRNKGYGAFSWTDIESGRLIQERAHRISYRLFTGQIPNNLFVLHTCDNPACCNPDHLFLGTKADNNRDMVEKGRHVPGGTHCGKHYPNGNWKHGTEHHGSKLNPDLVRQIREDHKTMSYSKLMKKYGLSLGCVSKVITRRTWNHVE